MQNFFALLLPVFILVVGFLFVTRFIFGRKVFQAAAGHWLYDISKTGVRIPFRILRFFFAYAGRLMKVVNKW